MAARYKAGQETETVDIIREEKVGGVVYTPSDRIIPKDHARQLVEKNAAVIIRANDTDEKVQEKVTRAVASTDKQASA